MHRLCIVLAFVLGTAAPAAAAWLEADDAAMDDFGMITAIGTKCGGASADASVMKAEVKKYLAIHAKTAKERARADAKLKDATAKAPDKLKTSSDPNLVCKLRDAATDEFIRKLKTANRTGASYQSVR